jgi:riboflavin kinase/FMN adenylyltransferase
MQVVETLEQAALDRPSVVTVGVFDGVHRGHQTLIEQVVRAAHQQGAAAVVISFFPHPDVVLQGITGRYYLTTPQEKARLLAALGVDVLVLHPFNAAVRQMRAVEFVERLQHYLRMVALWATPDFALGYRREGNMDFLRLQGAERGFSVQAIDLLGNDGSRISSSYLRDLLRRGAVQEASALFGRPYRLAGEVVPGEKRGRKLGFPTANLAIWEAQMIPAHGVYACLAHLGQEVFPAVINIGQRPTFEGQAVTVEAHILDLDRDLYGQTLALDFVEFLRGEQKFEGIAALVAQIGLDRDRARDILQNVHL